MALDRLRKELADVMKDTDSGVTAEPVLDNMQHLKATIKGPMDSPYEGGVFQVDIVIPDSYPFEPPKCKFVTRVWHPNVSSQTGAICLDILKDNWSPALTIKTALVSLQALLSTPEPDVRAVVSGRVRVRVRLRVPLCVLNFRRCVGAGPSRR